MRYYKDDNNNLFAYTQEQVDSGAVLPHLLQISELKYNSMKLFGDFTHTQAEVDEELLRLQEEAEYDTSRYSLRRLIGLKTSQAKAKIFGIDTLYEEDKALSDRYYQAKYALNGNQNAIDALAPEVALKSVDATDLYNGIKTGYELRRNKFSKVNTQLLGIKQDIEANLPTDVENAYQNNPITSAVEQEINSGITVWEGSQTSTGTINIPELQALVKGKEIAKITLFVKFATSSDPTMVYELEIGSGELYNGVTVVTNHPDADEFSFNKDTGDLSYTTTQTDNELFKIEATLR